MKEINKDIKINKSILVCSQNNNSECIFCSNICQFYYFGYEKDMCDLYKTILKKKFKMTYRCKQCIKDFGV